MGSSFDSDKLGETISTGAAGFVGNMGSGVEGAVESAKKLAMTFGYTPAADGSDTLSSIITSITDLIHSFTKFFTDRLDPTGAKAEAASRKVFDAGKPARAKDSATLNVDAAAREAIFKGVKDPEQGNEMFGIDGFLRNGVPPIDDKTGQRKTKKFLLGMRNQLMNFYIDQFSKQYPTANEEQINKAAKDAANCDIGYPALVDASEVIMLNRMGEPAEGSFGALVVQGQRSGRLKSHLGKAIPALTPNEAAYKAIATELGQPAPATADPAAEKFAQLVHQYLEQSTQAKTKLNQKYDTDGKSGISDDEAMAALQSQGITTADKLPNLKAFTDALQR